MNTVLPIKMGYCNKVLPLVYDDSLSYTEQVAKLVYKVNEVIASMENMEEEILAQAKAYTDNAIAETFAEVDARIAQLNQDIADQKIYFDNLVDETVRTFNGIVDDLQFQYNRFTQYVNAQLDEQNRKIDTVNQRLDDSVSALRTEMDLKIQLNNEYLIEEVTENLPSLMKVWNVLEGTQMTIQQMFDYLAYLHIVDGIDVQTLASRQLTVSYIAGLHRTVRDCVMYGNTILQ